MGNCTKKTRSQWNKKRRSNIKEQLLNLIYPKICGICEKGKNTYLCKKCENKLKEIAIFGKDEYLDSMIYVLPEKHIVRSLYEEISEKGIIREQGHKNSGKTDGRSV